METPGYSSPFQVNYIKEEGDAWYFQKTAEPWKP
jgi:hypothetical protein